MERIYQIRTEIPDRGIIYDHRINNLQDLELLGQLCAKDNKEAISQFDRWLKNHGYSSGMTIRLFASTGQLVKTFIR